ncbi:MAG: hypothetical protein E7Z85_00260 [Methanosphaera stadtmanae]|nr:hypothetical protein [Methanosphaera stadtmanae]
MNESNEKIIKQLEKHNNVLLYKEKLYEHFKEFNTKYNAVYISTPKKGKTAFEQILKKLNNDTITKNKTISKLLQGITEEIKDQKLYIFVDNFDQLSKRELQNYKELEQEENILLIVNINEDKEFVDEEFLNKFVIFDESSFRNNRLQSININYVILFLLSFLIFLLFLRIQLSILRYIVSGLWFTLLMYRSFYYISK